MKSPITDNSGEQAPHSGKTVEIAVPLPIDRLFSYTVPPGLEDSAEPGRRALVPFGSRKLLGFITGCQDSKDVSGLKPILSVEDQSPIWTPEQFEFFSFISSYYFHPLGEVLATAFSPLNSGEGKSMKPGARGIRRELYYRPAGIDVSPLRVKGKSAAILEALLASGESSRKELTGRFGNCSQQLKKLVELGAILTEEREAYRNPFGTDEARPDTAKSLNRHQELAYKAIAAAIDSRIFSPFLLYGVTGSGKTEVYLHSISHALKAGRKALVLVPEISLTPQLAGRFRCRFGNDIAILHSALSDGERYDEWRRILKGEARIVIGARSAIFAPISDMGIIIVDEEHEASYKQNDGVRYNARDLSLMLGKMRGIPVVLGSATPLLTSYHAAETGKLHLLTLPERIEGRPLPSVRSTTPDMNSGSVISGELAEALISNRDGGGQSMIMLDRRGYATFLACRQCRAIAACPNCSVTLTLHREKGASICHYCDYSLPAPGTCPSCGGPELKEMGAGTERLEESLRSLLPDARIIRMDSDTTSGKGAHARLLSKMSDGTADILFGTRMIAKGHDFPGVTLVGIINGEAGLGIPDFRSAERTFQILSQAIGRAGRGETPGEVIVQSAISGHYAVSCAVSHDYESFYERECEFRKEAGYPPFAHLASITVTGTSEKKVLERADETGAILRTLRNGAGARAEILGPAPAPFYRLRGRFRRRILIKSPSRQALRQIVSAWSEKRVPASGIREVLDIDPIDMM